MMVMALVGLNLVAALYRPAPAPFDDLLESPIRSTADLLVKPNGGIEIQPHGNPLVMKPDGRAGRLVLKAHGSTDSQSPTGGHGPPAGYENDPSRTLGTVVYKQDGGIVGYTGKPGEMRSRPHLIRAPMRSFLEMLWPVIASASITVLVLVILWRQARGRRIDPVTGNV